RAGMNSQRRIGPSPIDDHSGVVVRPGYTEGCAFTSRAAGQRVAFSLSALPPPGHRAGAASGGDRSSAISRSISANDGDLGHLEGEIAALADELGADPDQLLRRAG